ncbi:MAG: hypothetical protein ACKVYV_08420 [Limisphaerales bacterium]
MAFLVLAAAATSSCAGHRYGGYRGGYAYGPPPPPRYGPVGYAPRGGYVWCDGYWDRQPRGWAWAPGAWRRPPHARARWAPGHWQPHRNSYRFRPGYWR